MKKQITALLISMFVASSAIAAIPAVVTFKGKIGNFNEKTVSLKTETGEVTIPRKAFKKIEVRPGKVVSVKANLAEVIKLTRANHR